MTWDETREMLYGPADVARAEWQALQAMLQGSYATQGRIDGMQAAAQSLGMNAAIQPRQRPDERFERAVAYVKRKLSAEFWSHARASGCTSTPAGDPTIYGHPADPVIREVLARMLAEERAREQRGRFVAKPAPEKTPPQPAPKPDTKPAALRLLTTPPAWSEEVRSKFWHAVDWTVRSMAAVGAIAVARWAWQWLA